MDLMRFIRNVIVLSVLLYAAQTLALTPCGEDRLEKQYGPNLTWTKAINVNFELYLPLGIGHYSGKGVICAGSADPQGHHIEKVTYRDNQGGQKTFTIDELKQTKGLLSKEDIPSPARTAVRNGTIVTLKLEQTKLSEKEAQTRYHFRLRFMRKIVIGFSANDYRETRFVVVKSHHHMDLERVYEAKTPIFFDEFEFTLQSTALERMVFREEGYDQKVILTENLRKVDSVW